MGILKIMTKPDADAKYEDFAHEILTVEELMELLYIGKNTAR